MAKFTIENIQELFIERGYTLLSTEYVNSQTNLAYKCNRHPEEIRKIKLAYFNQGQGCSVCANDKRKGKLKLSFADVKSKFEERGYIFLSTEYVNNHTPLRYICPKHAEEERTITYMSFKRGSGCERCGRERSIKKLKAQGNPNIRKAVNARRISYSDVVARFEHFGLAVLTTEGEFIDTLHYIRCECPKHPGEQFKTYDDLKHQTHGCLECYHDSIRGEGSHLYNPELTDEERLAGRNTVMNRAWIKAVYEKDGYICLKCRQKGGKLNAHHKDGWNWCEARRYDITNGATLCKECHDDFHNKYGRGNNTEDQFKEWL